MELVDGKLNYVFNVGSGPRVVKANLRQDLNDNKWHQIAVVRNTLTTHMLRVDDSIAYDNLPGMYRESALGGGHQIAVVRHTLATHMLRVDDSIAYDNLPGMYRESALGGGHQIAVVRHTLTAHMLSVDDSVAYDNLPGMYRRGECTQPHGTRGEIRVGAGGRGVNKSSMKRNVSYVPIRVY